MRGKALNRRTTLKSPERERISSIREKIKVMKIITRSSRFHYPLMYCSGPKVAILRRISTRKRHEMILSRTKSQSQVEKIKENPTIAPTTARIPSETASKLSVSQLHEGIICVNWDLIF